MRTLVTLILISVSTLAYSQQYVQDTLSASDRGFLIRFTIVNDTTYLVQEVEQLQFELERLSEEAEQLIEQEKEVRKKLSKYKKVLKDEKDKDKDKDQKKVKANSIEKGRLLGPKEKY